MGDSASSSPQSAHYYESKQPGALHDVYISPSAEVRSAARRASLKLQQQSVLLLQQQMDSVNINIEMQPPLPMSPPPLDDNCESKKEIGHVIPIIDESNGENEEELSSYHSLKEKF